MNLLLRTYFKFPNAAETYVHRSGRCGRAGRNGTAVTLLKDSDFKNYKKVLHTLKKAPLDDYSGEMPPKFYNGSYFYSFVSF